MIVMGDDQQAMRSTLASGAQAVLYVDPKGVGARKSGLRTKRVMSRPFSRRSKPIQKINKEGQAIVRTWNDVGFSKD